MTNRKMFCILGVAAVCLPLLSGCGGKGSDASGGATATTNGGQTMLNNPNTSDADKEKIRKSMQSSPGGAAGSSGGATSGQ
jgi:hypothetical protein